MSEHKVTEQHGANVARIPSRRDRDFATLADVREVREEIALFVASFARLTENFDGAIAALHAEIQAQDAEQIQRVGFVVTGLADSLADANVQADDVWKTVRILVQRVDDLQQRTPRARWRAFVRKVKRAARCFLAGFGA